MEVITRLAAVRDWSHSSKCESVTSNNLNSSSARGEPWRCAPFGQLWSFGKAAAPRLLGGKEEERVHRGGDGVWSVSKFSYGRRWGEAGMLQSESQPPCRWGDVLLVSRAATQSAIDWSRNCRWRKSSQIHTRTNGWMGQTAVQAELASPASIASFINWPNLIKKLRHGSMGWRWCGGGVRVCTCSRKLDENFARTKWIEH